MNPDLIASLTRGFVDHTTPATPQLLPKLIVNDKARGVTVLSTVLQHLGECDYFWLTVAFATKSGVLTLLRTLLDLEERQVRGQVLVSQYLDFTQPAALRTLLQLSNITLRIATTGNFHAKGYLFKKPLGLFDLLIGSSNLTAGALKVNKEWNLHVTASEHGELLPQVRAEFDQSSRRRTPLISSSLTTMRSFIKRAPRRLSAWNGRWPLLAAGNPIPCKWKPLPISALCAQRASERPC
jgi:HKD family nuclease